MAPPKDDDHYYPPYVPNPRTGRLLLIAVGAAAAIVVVIAIIAWARGGFSSSGPTAAPSPTPHAVRSSYKGSFTGASATCPVSNPANTTNVCQVPVTIPPGDSTIHADFNPTGALVLGVGLRDPSGKTVQLRTTPARGSLEYVSPHLSPGHYVILVGDASAKGVTGSYTVSVTVD